MLFNAFKQMVSNSTTENIVSPLFLSLPFPLPAVLLPNSHFLLESKNVSGWKVLPEIESNTSPAKQDHFGQVTQEQIQMGFEDI